MSHFGPKLSSSLRRGAIAVAVALLAGGAAWASASDPAPARTGAPARVPADEPETEGKTEPETEAETAVRGYEDVVRQLEERRRQLAKALGDAAGEPALLAQAEGELLRALVEEVLPRWVGLRWSRGAESVARQPAAGAAINCGSFVVAALEGAGFRIAHRDQLARAPALRLLEAVAGDGGIARWRGTVPALERELLRRGPGVYLLGLTRHIGFAVVGEGEVRLVHASRTSGAVVIEPMGQSPALRRSHGTAIFAAALLGGAGGERNEKRGKASARAGSPLVRRWLSGAALGPS